MTTKRGKRYSRRTHEARESKRWTPQEVMDTEPNSPERKKRVDEYLSAKRAEHPERW